MRFLTYARVLAAVVLLLVIGSVLHLWVAWADLGGDIVSGVTLRLALGWAGDHVGLAIVALLGAVIWRYAGSSQSAPRLMQLAFVGSIVLALCQALFPHGPASLFHCGR